MKEFLLVTVMSFLLFATQSWAGEAAQGKAAEKERKAEGIAAGASAGKAVAEDAVKDEKPFVDRDGDGIRDGQEHRFRKRKHGQHDQEGEDETGTGNLKRKRTMQGQPSGDGQNRKSR